MVLGAIVVAWIVGTVPTGSMAAAVEAGESVKRAGDFPHFYFAADAALEGRSIFGGFANFREGGYLYPPFLAAALTPLVPLGLDTAAFVWWVLIAGLLGVLWYASVREMARRWALPGGAQALAGASAIVAVVFADPIRAFLALGQTDSLVLLGFAAPLVYLARGARRDRPTLAAIGLAISASIKFLPLALLPYFVATQRWGVLWRSIAGLIVIALLPALVLGWSANLRYLGASLAGLGQVVGLSPPDIDMPEPPTLAWSRSRSILSGFARLADWFEQPHAYAYAGAALLLCVWAALAAWLYRRHGLGFLGRLLRPSALPEQVSSRIVALEICSIIAAILALGPQTAKRHAIILLPAMLLAALFLVAGRSRLSRVQCGIGLGLLLVTSVLPARSGFEIGSIGALWDVAGAIGGFGWAIAAFSLLLLDAGLREARLAEDSLSH